MAEDEAQERTEEATEKRKREAREKGNIVRSKELNSMAVLVGGGLILMAQSESMSQALLDLFEKGFILTKADVFDSKQWLIHLSMLFENIVLAFLPFFGLLFIITLFVPMLVSGPSFSFEAIMPKLDRLDPIQGIKKMFSMKALMEMIKAILKFLIVVGMFFVVVNVKISQVANLDLKSLSPAISDSASILMYTLLVLSSGLIIITMIDVPFQLWDHAKKLKMSRQEVRDEHKDTEGRPEVKSKVRSMQREISRRRMMSNVPKADVIITNPTHYAVALKYDESFMGAPVVVAKGADLVAEMIKKVGNAHEVPFLSVPPLARALFWNVEIDEEVPSGLYVAVAKVLAYVFELKLYKQGKAKRPNVPSEFPIPDELRRDE